MAEPPDGLKRLYAVGNNTRELLLAQNDRLTADETGFQIADFGTSLAIFRIESNLEDPKVVLGYGATFVQDGIRPEVLLYRKTGDASPAEINRFAGDLRQGLRRDGVNVTVSDAPVVQIGRRSGAYFQQDHNPIFPGVSISAVGRELDGTLGFFALRPDRRKALSQRVRRTSSTVPPDAPVLVSAGHVLIPEQSSSNWNVQHPGASSAKAQNIFARRIASDVVGFAPEPRTEAPCDGAAAFIDSGVEYLATAVGDGDIVSWLDHDNLTEHQIKDSVLFKAGMGNGIRRGNLDGYRESVAVSIVNSDGRVVGVGRIKDLLIVTPLSDDEVFSMDSDSGAPVLIELEKGRYTLVGIVVAALPTKRGQRAVSYVSPIWNLAEHLELKPLPVRPRVEAEQAR